MPPDFKRRKAKVGKRATHKVNETDTSFKAASLQVRGQSVAKKIDQDQLYSRRGRSLAELVAQLHHPAVNVRISASKGINDITGSFEDKAESLKANLSSFLPPIGRGLVDDEPVVRTLALSALGTVLRIARDVTAHAALIVAFVQSALNSLDAPTRKDGLQALELLSNAGATAEHWPRLLANFARLFADQTKADDKARLLRCLASLLRASGRSDTTSSSHVLRRPDLTVSEQSKNALLMVDTRRSRKRPRPINSLDDLFSGASEASDGISSGLTPPEQMQLWTKLRDCFLELTQEGSIDMVGLEALSEVMCLLWPLSTTEFVGKAQTDWRKLVSQLVSLILDVLPLSNADAGRINGNLCVTIYRMRTYTRDKDPVYERVVDHLRSTFESFQPGQFHNQTMNVLEDVVFHSETDSKSAKAAARMEKSRLGLVQAFVDAFFTKPESELCRSPEGRRALSTADRLFASCDYDVKRAKERFGPSLDTILSEITVYLTALRGDFENESILILRLLHGYLRYSASNGPLLKGWRSGMQEIVGASFSHMPESLQRMILDYMVALKTPTQESLTSLASFVQKSGQGSEGLSDATAGYIVESVHAIRRTINMQQYLTFLIDSTGIMSVSSRSCQDSSFATALDRRLRRSLSCLVDCGGAKVFPKIYPLLIALVERVCSDNEGRMENLVQCRAAVSIIAALCLDSSDAFDALPPDGPARIILATTRWLALLPSEASLSLHPIVALLSIPTLLPALLRTCMEETQSPGEGINVANLLTNLGRVLSISSNTTLRQPELHESIEPLKALSNGSMAQQAEKVLAFIAI